MRDLHRAKKILSRISRFITRKMLLIAEKLFRLIGWGLFGAYHIDSFLYLS